MRACSRRAFLKLLGLSAAALSLPHLAAADAVPLTRRALPLLIAALRNLGATFHALPRPADQPNAPTVGIGYPPTPDPLGEACAP
ncbi:MAG: hypothetical protein D6749_09680 [Chloroflexota bacterium]|jgi:hypothetical protein|nr:MAG: hypothetical protein D6749_09680 [Chloroflexota bacterium]